mmetsp:Transcript_13192/g.27028  ORF Transcript_13192/g.27028 Transcript_13192/m.27028 type:complete len:481 (-) Transcript_13192:155-1597(-)
MSSSTRISARSAPIATSTSTTTTTATATATATSTFDTTTKKKFGKNLNKLTAPPVAPVPQGSTTKVNSSSKNGFLLLSTKRPSSGNTTGTVSGGILSSKSTQNSAKPIPSLGLHTEFSSSTHDALLGVVVGASRPENQQQPDAWGVAEKQQQEQSQHTQVQQQDNPAATAVSTTGSDNTKSRERERERERERLNEIEEKTSTKHSAEVKNKQQPQEQEPERSNDDSLHAEFRASNWDEYGGRNIQANDGKTSNETFRKNEGNEDQVAFMKKLARQRAEKKRDEEENRMMEQKERAAQRLRELEKKMAMKKKEDAATKAAKITKSFDVDNNINININNNNNNNNGSKRWHGGPHVNHDHAHSVHVTFVDGDGKPIKADVDAYVGESLLQVAQRNDIELEGACEGVCACSTCHVIFPDWDVFESLEEASEDEEDMLDMAFGLTETSRLSCQIIVTEEMDGLTVEIPKATRNFYVDGHVPVPH